ncbi:ABC transporter ATP-binding protein [Actinoplanes friuliensis]|uniref:ABC transporter n=1 Tax=Actinoplanes friuliensis DSM 7358 TaxID=1246995 RepID=U5W810_9ACTN|nr:ABC transporter ATP-binding protein [Actinoplanes friuliensis]AGZ44105.1 ABC transporter [Actinoplanes friuliensis DSM 7358]
MEGSTDDKKKPPEVSLRRVGGLLKPHWPRLTAVIAIIVASSLVGMATPFLLRAIIDRALPAQDLELLTWLVVGLIAVAVMTAVFGITQTWIATAIGQRVMHQLRVDVFTHLHRQSVAFFTRTRAGEIQSRITNDIGGMQAVVTSTATSIASNLTTAVATAVAMLVLSWQLFLVSLIVLPPALLLARRVARMRKEITAQRQRELADLNVIIEESLSISGVQLSKIMGTGPALIDRFAGSSARLVDLQLRAQLTGRWRGATMNIIFAAIPAIIYLSAGLPPSAGKLTIGTIVAFTSLQSRLFQPMMGLLDVGVSLASSTALFARVFEYLDLPVEVDDPVLPVRLPLPVRGHLRFDDVSFTYPGSVEPAISGITLNVPPGSSIALVGETGSGKSTVASLIVRLYDPTEGRITVDGFDLRALRLNELVGVIGMVGQETYLLHASVRENLRYARPDATDEQIEWAARAAQVHDVIVALPEGYDTVVGSRGHRFSGGEKQRIAIARTLLRNPPILVLDEATSALDNTTERAVQRALEELARGRTTVTIAHRLSTIRNADQIVVMRGGRILEAGTHDSLILIDGFYAALTA